MYLQHQLVDERWRSEAERAEHTRQAVQLRALRRAERRERRAERRVLRARRTVADLRQALGLTSGAVRP